MLPLYRGITHHFHAKSKFMGIVFLLLCSFFSSYSLAEEVDVLNKLERIPPHLIDRDEDIVESPYIAYAIGDDFKDPHSLDELIHNGRLRLQLTKKEIKIGYNNTYTGFFYRLAPQKTFATKRFLVINHRLAGEIKIFRKVGENGKWDYIGSTGSAIAYRYRLNPTIKPVVPIVTHENQSVYYFLSRSSTHRFDGYFQTMTEDVFHYRESRDLYIYMLYIGAFLALVVFNFLLYISLGDVIYLYYCSSAIFVHLAGLSVTGILDFATASLYISPSEYQLFYTGMAVFTTILFSARFYSIATYSRFITVVFQFLMAFSLINVLAYIGPWEKLFGSAYLGYVIDGIAPLSIFAMLAGGVISYRKGNVMAKFYLVSWGCFFGGTLIYFGHYAGIFSRNVISSNGILIGNLLEMIGFSLGMAYKISILDQEKSEALIRARGKSEYQRMVRVLLHDLSNPVGLIQYYVGLKKSRPDEFEAKSAKAWDKIRFGLTKLSEIISFHREQEVQINKLTRTVSLSPILLREVFIEVELMFEERLEMKGLKLNFEGPMDIFVKAERVSFINEVMSNLISNGIKFSPPGGVITIATNTAKENGEDIIYIHVKDEGKGFSADQIQTFERDHFLESTLGTKGEKGSGFGLSLIKGYMEVYEGEMKILTSDSVIDGNSKSLHHGAVIRLKFNRY